MWAESSSVLAVSRPGARAKTFSRPGGHALALGVEPPLTQPVEDKIGHFLFAVRGHGFVDILGIDTGDGHHVAAQC